MRASSVFGAAGLAFALAACGHANAAQSLADQTTKAVFNTDLTATQKNFDDDLKKQVTREQIGIISDKMHALGAYKGLKPAASDPDKGRYAFEADFDNGVMAVEVRLDPDGKIGAYRVADAQT
jgi:hypothetical protein